MKKLETFEVSGVPEDIGFTIVQIDADLIQNQVLQLTEFRETELTWQDSSYLQELLTAARYFFQEYVLELEGMARGAQVEYETSLVQNSRGNLPLSDDGIPESAKHSLEDSTTILYPAAKSSVAVIAHNEDGPPELDVNCSWFSVRQENGSKFSTFHYPGMLPGHTLFVNSNGLVQTINNFRVDDLQLDKSGKFFDVTADLLLLHNGVVPNVQITRNLGCEHSWYDVQRYWEPIVDDWGNTSVEHVSIAGDCGRVAGAAISEVSGHLAALETVYQLGVISKVERDNLSQPHRIELARHKHVRPFLDKLFQPSKTWLVPENDKTLACRCEEVKVSEIRETVRMGIKDPDSLKSMTRCGMGYCQARMCGLTVSEIIAEEKKVSPEEIGYFKVRSPIRPITLGQLAEID